MLPPELLLLFFLSICQSSSETESEWVRLLHPPETLATTPSAEIGDDLLEFRPRPSPTPAPELQPRGPNELTREQGGYLFDGPTDDVVAFYRAQQVKKLKRLLFLVVIDAGSSKTVGDLWQTSVISEMNKTPITDWKNMKIKRPLAKTSNLRSFFSALKSENLDFLARKSSKLFSSILLKARNEITELVQGLDPDLVIPDVPVILHSTAGLRDMDVDSRRKLFDAIGMVMNGDLDDLTQYAGEYHAPPPLIEEDRVVSTRFEIKHPKTNKVMKVMRFFTTRQYCRAITGIEEAVFTFITANIASGAIQEMKTDPVSGKKRLAGILEVGGASMQVVFPVENQIRDGPLGTLDLTLDGRFLKREMFPKMTEPFNVFGTSYMNLGINRALALLQKMYCEDPMNQNSDGRCYFPCLNVGWRQVCVPGSPKRRELKTKGDGLSMFETDTSGRVLMDGNHLFDTANFCSKDNKILRYMITPLQDCKRAGFGHLLEKNLTERARIHRCNEIIGTGDRNKCGKIIKKHLFMSELPGNQETLSETGAAAPAEIGQFLSPKGMMFVVGNSLFYPIKQLKAWGMLNQTWYRSSTTGELRVCDLTELRHAADLLCGAKLSSSHSFVNTNLGGETLVSLDQFNFDFCYKAVYADTLLSSINATPGVVQMDLWSPDNEDVGQVLHRRPSRPGIEVLPISQTTNRDLKFGHNDWIRAPIKSHPKIRFPQYNMLGNTYISFKVNRKSYGPS